ncbi:MAG TPA: ribosome silencing factor [Actinomycetota bacterium]|nr:ribosome silencing factor [Actinomycetota bacterium]
MTGSDQLAAVAAGAASAKQARDVVVLDVRDLIAITDYFVIASGTSDRQVRTIAEEIESALRREGLKPVRREGMEDARWVLLDFVDLVAHVFQQDDRDYYSLERLWGDAPRLAWEARAASSG